MGDAREVEHWHAERLSAAPSGPPDGDIIDPDMLGLGRGPHIVVKPDFVDAQIRRGAPAHILLTQLLDAVDPHFLEAVGLADGVQFEMEDDLLPLAGDQCGLRRWLEKHGPDRKSTRLNSSHSQISYAVFCLKKKKKNR